MVLEGPLSGLVHQQILGSQVGSRDASLWLHHMTRVLTVPPHYHEKEETVVVLTGRLTFQLGKSIDDLAPGEDPMEGAQIIECGPDSTFQIPARTVHGYIISGVPARVLIFLPEPDGITRLPDGSPMPLPWSP